MYRTVNLPKAMLNKHVQSDWLCMLQAVEEGGAGISKTLALHKRVPFGHGAAHVSRPPPPTLHQLFSRTSLRAESSGEIANISDDEEGEALSPSHPPLPLHKANAAISDMSAANLLKNPALTMKKARLSPLPTLFLCCTNPIQ